MGLHLVAAAFEHARRAGLEHAPTRLLVYMSSVAYDPGTKADVEPCRFFQGRADMARALGKDMPDKKPGRDASPSERKAWEAGDAAVARALNALIEAGAIKRVTAGSRGWNAEFRVVPSAVDPALLGQRTVDLPDAERAPMADAERAPGDHAERAPMGTLSVPPNRTKHDLTKTRTRTREPAPSHLRSSETIPNDLRVAS